jgi:4-amino-4-deoxy-L-arabinose transferase-like glycosyltransferase
LLRFHDLPTRGTWDADQGHDMLVLTHFVGQGEFPLLGPPTSIGDFHHGALYYYVLAPAAWLGGGNPAVVVGEIALLGLLAVGLVASLARSAGGIVAGIAAGLLMAVSATAVDESTFLWNPNLVAFGSALAIAGTWRAWRSGHARWWLVTAVGEAITMQAHVLGWALLPPLVVWLAADARRRSGSDRGRVLLAGLGGLVLIVASYAPLIASELQTGFHETHSAIAFLAGGGQSAAADPLVRLVFVSLRILAWPLTGLLTSALTLGVLAAVGTLAALVWRVRAASEPERALARWIGVTILWSCLVLGVGVSSLATVTPLPVDHYHAFIDPLVYIAVGLGVAGLWQLRPPAGRRVLSAGRVGGLALTTVLIAWNIGTQPPAVAHDGGYPAAEAAAARIGRSVSATGIVRSVSADVTLVRSLPQFKTAEAYLYPLEQLRIPAGSMVTDPLGLASLVILCDDLFVTDCGGPAEDAAAPAYGRPTLVDRFSAAPRRTISVYRLGGN